MLLQDDDGQVQETHSVSAGLDYSGVGPEHALLQAIGRVKYISATDDEALDALERAVRQRGHTDRARNRARLRRRAQVRATASRARAS